MLCYFSLLVVTCCHDLLQLSVFLPVWIGAGLSSVGEQRSGKFYPV